MPRRPSHALVVSYLALFVAIGGTAYAGVTLTGKDITDGSITGADLHNGSVRSADVKGITGADLGPGAAWTLRSPDKRFSVAVTNDGVTMEGPAGAVAVSGTGVAINASGAVDIRSSGTVRVGGALTLLGTGTNCKPLVDASHIHNVAGSETGPAKSGLSPTVMVCG